MLPSRRGDRVEASAAIVLRHPPTGRDPAAILEAAQGGVERAFLDTKHVPGRVFDPASDGVAVGGAEQQGLEDEDGQRALEEVVRVALHVPLARVWEWSRRDAPLSRLCIASAAAVLPAAVPRHKFG